MLSLRAAMLGMALIITLPIGCSTIQKELYLRRSIPKKFHQTWYFVEGACNRFLSYQGAYAIGLRDDTIMQIEEQGLKFFSDIRDPANAAETNYYRGEWKPTPVPRAWYSEGAIPNLYCGAENALFWPKGIEDAVKRTGSYYLDGVGARNLYVIPSLGLIVASGNDR